MSEKKRQKKDGADKNKNNQRMREANKDSGSRNVAPQDNGPGGHGKG